ncbi:MAG TPA: hypothetical protein VFV58_05350 [Blastocatellia bacterium]|jgi:hypothetical protein|nr:hypothetical protein [Blastocatellia bacterium]
MVKRYCLSVFLLALIGLAISPVGFAQAQSGESVIPEGTEIQLALLDPVSSKLSEPGDEIRAVVRRDVVVDGRRLLREGTEVVGRVTLAQPAKRPLKGGRLHITFDRIRLEGSEQKIAAVLKSASDFTRDEKVKSDSEGTLKQGAGGGQVLDNVLTAAELGSVGVTIALLGGLAKSDGGIGSFSGAAVGGLAVMGGSIAAGVLLTKGKEVRLDESAVIRLKLVRPVSIE